MQPLDYFCLGVIAGCVGMGAFASLIMRMALEDQKRSYSRYVEYYRTHVWGH